MIIRPSTEGELLALLTDIHSDPEIELDTRGLLTFLLLRRDFSDCPPKGVIAFALGTLQGRWIGVQRLNRMMSEAERAGYVARATWRVPRKGKAPAYCFVIGSKAAVATERLRCRGD